MATTSQSQTNGVPSSSSAGPSQAQSQPTQNTTTSGTATLSNTQSTATLTAGPSNGPSSPTAHAPRPRDARTIELLLTSQGVTSFDNRVPLLLLDFAYRHTSSILNDALHLAADPYTSHAGAKPSAASGAVPMAPSNSDATLNPNAVNLAIASRQAYQFRGGSGAGGTGGGGASKDWLMELARERNRVALPRVLANEWGVRLPNERFVLSGVGWQLRDHWAGAAGPDSDDDEDGDGEGGEGGADEMEGLEDAFGPQKKESAPGAEGEEGGGLGELIGDDMEDDEDMDGME
ncbi:Uu.00g035270.m01.CDS01 [Anthostomella pinea]|uniref:Uu.00g035270.m01.CDS01 n=1 Tax=Anthostomella pinea TaxID=933095 RepID=A0AAI8V980_9PEZI|nr:Uu.00g035270.m01.CDS01 [Anthostomella pinea]